MTKDLTSPRNPAGSGATGRCGQRRSEAGFSLIELMIACLLLGIVLAIVAGALTSVMRAQSSIRQQSANQSAAQLGLNVAGRDIRTAIKVPGNSTPFLAAGGTYLLFTAALRTNTAPVEIALSVTQGTLYEALIVPTTASCTGFVYPAPPVEPAGSAVATGYANTPTTAPLFTFYDANNAVLATDPSGNLSTSQLSQVASVVVSPAVLQPGSNRAVPTFTLRASVGMPNLTFNPTGNVCS